MLIYRNPFELFVPTRFVVSKKIYIDLNIPHFSTKQIFDYISWPVNSSRFEARSSGNREWYRQKWRLEGGSAVRRLSLSRRSHRLSPAERISFVRKVAFLLTRIWTHRHLFCERYCTPSPRLTVYYQQCYPYTRFVSTPRVRCVYRPPVNTVIAFCYR